MASQASDGSSPNAVEGGTGKAEAAKLPDAGARSSGPRKSVAEKGAYATRTRVGTRGEPRQHARRKKTVANGRRDVAHWKISTKAREGRYRIVGTGQSAARGSGHSSGGYQSARSAFAES
jgi:hypothetical protein